VKRSISCFAETRRVSLRMPIGFNGLMATNRLDWLHLVMSMSPEQPRNPLHGVTLERMLNELVEEFGWETMGKRIRIRCFNDNPSIKSSLAFLRKTPWARQKVEEMYLMMLRFKARAQKLALPPVPRAD
jgi:uncharacterized protein (DUF2132 family)